MGYRGLVQQVDQIEAKHDQADGNQNEQPAHCWRSLFGFLPFRCILADVLSDLEAAQDLDQRTAPDNGHHKGDTAKWQRKRKWIKDHLFARYERRVAALRL